MGEGYSKMGLPKPLALAADDDAGRISRHGAFLGLSAAIAAPFVIRTAGILMPVRDRTVYEMYDQYGMRDYKRFPATLEEVMGWRRSQRQMAERRVMISLSGVGATYVSAMSDAEKRYEARGLLGLSGIRVSG